MGNVKYILLMIISLIFVGSCVRADIDHDVAKLEESTIMLHLSSSSKSFVGGSTRATDQANELRILRGYIFVFSQGGVYQGFQKISALDVEDNSTQYPVIKTTISGYDSKSDKLIAVFNYNGNINVDEDSFDQMTKESVSDFFPLDKAYLDALQADIAEGKYSLGMPMFVNDFDNDTSSTVHEVYRSLARIELYVKETKVSTSLVGHTHTFTPENVKFTLINSAANGEIGYASRAEIKGKEGGATYQVDQELSFDYRPTEFTDVSEVTSSASSKNAIYLYEFPYSTKVISGGKLVQGDYDPDRLSILIEHEDNEAHPGEVLYYKLQLVDKSNNEYYDIKRNHDYRVVITDVYSNGYTDVNEAYFMPPSNIEYEIFDNKGDLTLSNGQYAISMDEVLNYDNVTIYGPDETHLSFDNIRRILPSEVVDPLTDEELAEMTNIVEFEVKSEDGVLVSVDQNDFSSDPVLTDKGKSIKLTLTGEGECVIMLKIQLGNLKIGFDNITIQKIGSALGGDSSFDAHPCQLRVENKKLIEGTWNSPDSDFGARNDGDDMIIYMGENATPVGYKSLNGYISTASAANAYPYFEPKTRSGYYSYYDLEKDPECTTVKKTKIVLNQLAPFYVGHFGAKADSGPHYYDALIVEKIEEIRDTDSTPNKETGGLMYWSEQLGHVYFKRSEIYGSYLGLEKYLNFSEGLDIANYIVDNNATEGALPLAARYCYMKNDIDGDGVIEADEPIVWFLPAANQMLAMWVSKFLIDSEVDSKYFGFNLEYDMTPWYWTCTEVASTEDERNNYVFDNNVARFNMLEGELSVSGRKGNNTWDDRAHVRCVRGIVYDNH